MKKIVYILTLALFLLSCGSNGSKNIESTPTEFRILKVVENNYRETYYDYNEKNLLSQKRTFLVDGNQQDTEEFIYNSNNQLIKQSKQGHILFTYSSIDYKYGTLLSAQTALPVVVSHDANSSVFGTLTDTYVEYSYTLNEQNSATSLESTILYRNTIGAGMVPDEERVIEYSYDTQERLILKGARSYSYNEFGKLALESEEMYKTLYSYDENHRIVSAQSFAKDAQSLEWRETITKNYFYEEGVYDSSGFVPNYFDQGQYIDSGIY